MLLSIWVNKRSIEFCFGVLMIMPFMSHKFTFNLCFYHVHLKWNQKKFLSIWVYYSQFCSFGWTVFLITKQDFFQSLHHFLIQNHVHDVNKHWLKWIIYNLDKISEHSLLRSLSSWTLLSPSLLSSFYSW